MNHQSVKVIKQQKTIRAEIAAGVAVNGLQTLQLIASAYIEYRQVVEQERTTKREIEACEKEAIARIEAQKKL